MGSYPTQVVEASQEVEPVTRGGIFIKKIGNGFEKIGNGFDFLFNRHTGVVWWPLFILFGGFLAYNYIIGPPDYSTSAPPPTPTFAELKTEAEGGYPPDQYNLAARYYGDRDYKEALKWYRKAAEQGHGNAQIELGLMYAHGLGVQQDFVTALAWMYLADPHINGHTYHHVYVDIPNQFGGISRARSSLDQYAYDANWLQKVTSVTGKMTQEQINKGYALGRDMLKKNPRLIKPLKPLKCSKPQCSKPSYGGLCDDCLQSP